MERGVTCARLASRRTGTSAARAFGREELRLFFLLRRAYVLGYFLPRLRRFTGIRAISLLLVRNLRDRLNVMEHQDQRPSVGIAHAVLRTDRMADSLVFMRTIGMRLIFEGPDVSVLEMRGGTHLILMRAENFLAGDASFDLMVDNLHDTHRRFVQLGLSPGPIEARPEIDHEVFSVKELAGNKIVFFSSHASGKPT